MNQGQKSMKGVCNMFATLSSIRTTILSTVVLLGMGSACWANWVVDSINEIGQTVIRNSQRQELYNLEALRNMERLRAMQGMSGINRPVQQPNKAVMPTRPVQPMAKPAITPNRPLQPALPRANSVTPPRTSGAVAPAQKVAPVQKRR